MPNPTEPDDLYGLPLEEFTAARNALAKELARAGDKEAAAGVKRLVKPPKTAWALNQLARQQPEVVARLLESGDRLRAAQQRALDGDAGGLRDATKAEQEQVTLALEAALAVFGGAAAASSEGPTAERLRRTLRAAATDPAVGDLLRRGRLSSDVEASGFGLDGLSDEGPGEGPVPRQRDQQEKDEERARHQARRDAQREADRLARQADMVRERADRLAEEAARAAQRASETRRAADEAVKAAEEAERLAGEAAADADRLDANR